MCSHILCFFIWWISSVISVVTLYISLFPGQFISAHPLQGGLTRLMFLLAVEGTSYINFLASSNAANL